MFNATLINTRNAHATAAGIFGQVTYSREANVEFAKWEDTIRCSENVYGTIADYRSPNFGWSRTVDASFFISHQLQYPEGAAAMLYREALRDNFKFDDQLARTPRLDVVTVVDAPLTPDSIVAGVIDEDKALAGRRKLREILESKLASETLVTSLRAQLAAVNEYDVRTLSASSEKTWHLFVGAAQSAERREYCGEYDSIAGDGEIPTRTQLRDAGMLSGGSGTMRVSISFTVYVDTDNIDDPTEDSNWSSNVDRAAVRYIEQDLNGEDYEYEVSN